MQYIFVRKFEVLIIMMGRGEIKSYYNDKGEQ